MLNSCGEAISLPIYLLYTKLLNSMIVPKSWRMSIFEKGFHFDSLNYRQSVRHLFVPRQWNVFCILSSTSILRITISWQKLNLALDQSVQEQFILTYDYVTREHDLGRVLELVLFDFKKAFDLVPHGNLLAKLSGLGFRDPILVWIKDFFLCGRLIRVVVNGSASPITFLHVGSIFTNWL